MFNTYINKSSNYVPVPYTKNVIIGRAPTDESVKLLSEFEQAALNKLMGVIEVNNNNFNFTCHVFSEPASFGCNLYVRYKLNEKLHEFNVPIRSRMECFSEKEILIKLHEELVKSISTQLSTEIVIDFIKNKN